MPDNAKLNGWTSVIKSVRTPLGFFTLVALVLDAILLAEGALTARVPMWAPVVLLGFLIACVFAIVLVNPLALYHPSDWPTAATRVTVKLLFPIEPIEVDLDTEQCVLEIRDETGRRKSKGTPNLTWGHGGWTFRLPEDLADTDSVRLELVEHSQRKWNVKPFPPYETDVKVFQLA